MELRRGRFVWHVTSRPSEAQITSMTSQISKCLIKTVLKCIPSKPEEGKWTKDPPAIDWYVTIAAVLPLGALVDNAFLGMKVAVVSEADRGSSTHMLSFHEAQGGRRTP